MPTVLTLTDLCRTDPADLDAVYAEATTPSPEELDGDYDGVLLSGQFPPQRKAFPITFVNQPWLPWRGKSFTAGGSRGANRFRVAGKKVEIWPFVTRVTPSMFGGEPSVLVDYDLPGNSWWQRHCVFDELKKVRGSLYLGKGGIRLAGKSRFLFYWALAVSSRPHAAA